MLLRFPCGGSVCNGFVRNGLGGGDSDKGWTVTYAEFNTRFQRPSLPAIMAAMRALRLVALCGAIVLMFVGDWSCGGGNKRCSDSQLEPFRRYDCGDGTVECSKSGVRLGPLTPEQQQFVACCSCDTPGAPTCKACDQMGY
jgi:hypothetical protein